ncbi:crotonase/enoyl-CoA hydratase family protein [Mycobacterium sp. NAZ190054]|uniref:crotonase/enoyl-CoA hydratase family protein n=1 Tax=Mycobacterium sp. NAZ190054 TaxID=1747766 RepID=UPI000795CF25|nr:crotonase/enoyl-CoA hydratase family protein [Mycobacterium sp. NAZ190054]KWX68758.1 enoyl-CoA hydratase [Mycobacterium sp. NAZ190054]
MTAALLVERHDGVETWTLNRPHQRNPITDDDMVAAVVAAVARADDGPDVRCIVLTGADPAFSAGGNIKEIRSGARHFGAPPYLTAEGYRAGVQRLAAAVFGCQTPVIAAVNGPAIGAGCDLALMCDVRIASPRARFAESFVQLGLVSGDGGSWLLPRAVGASRAAEMSLTGDPIDADTAAAWGLVSRVVPHDELLSAAQALAARIAANPPAAVRMAKRLLRQGEHGRFTEALESAAALQALAHHTADHRAAVSEHPGPYTGR